MEKIINLFGLAFEPEERQRLVDLSQDERVQVMHVLPSFKLKRETARWADQEMHLVRADDTIVVSPVFHPQYCYFQIGCGYATFLLDIDISERTNTQLVEVCKRFARLTGSLASRFLRLAQDRLSGQGRAGYFHPYSVPRDQWLQTVAGGVRQYLADRADPYRFQDHLSAFASQGKHFSGHLETVRDVVDPAWWNGDRHFIHDGNIARFTGSHFVDLLYVKSSSTEANQRTTLHLQPGKVILTIHAHGTNFWNVLKPAFLAELIQGRALTADETGQLLQVIALMNNQAAINRVSLAYKFCEIMTEVFGQVRITPIVEQPHYDVVQQAGQYYYYRDAQRLVADRPCLLPAGNPRVESYLVLPGSEAERAGQGISHSLKRYLSRFESDSFFGSQQVRFLDVSQTEFQMLGKSISGRARIYEKRARSLSNRQLPGLLNTMSQLGIIQPWATLQPLIRLHTLRPGEEPFRTADYGR